MRIPMPRRNDARYCSSACRQKAYRARKSVVPASMKARVRWVRHDARKRPLTAAGWAASVTDSSTWGAYADVVRSEHGTGVGIVLGDGLGCIDLDHCITDGVVAPWAEAIIDEHRRDAVLIERSMSGEGVHIFLPMAEAPGTRVRDGVRSVETYSRARYIAVTGDRL